MPSQTAPFESVLEAMADALVGVDQEGIIRFVNHQTELLFGYDRDDLVGRPVETLLPESLRQLHQAQNDPDVQFLIETVFSEDARFTVGGVAASAEEALELARTTEPGLRAGSHRDYHRTGRNARTASRSSVAVNGFVR